MAASRRSRVADRWAHALIAAFSAGAAMIGSDAKADEAYVCEGGRVVYVRFGELEAKKKTDPCIAAHYARANRRGVEALANAADDGAPLQLPAVIAGDGAPPLPVRNAARLGDGASETPSVEIGPAPSEQVEAEAMELKRRVEAVVFRHRMRRQAAEASEQAATPIDFRRVPILNARPGEPAVFLHTR